MKKENIKKGKIMSLENTIKNRKGITLIALVVTIVLNCSFLAMVVKS